MWEIVDERLRQLDNAIPHRLGQVAVLRAFEFAFGKTPQRLAHRHWLTWAGRQGSLDQPIASLAAARNGLEVVVHGVARLRVRSAVFGRIWLGVTFLRRATPMPE